MVTQPALCVYVEGKLQIPLHIHCCIATKPQKVVSGLLARSLHPQKLASMELMEGCGSNSDVSCGSNSDATSDRIPARYVLLYTVDRVESVPEGQLNLVLAPLNNPDVNPEAPEKCCSDNATWSDPHVYHSITLHCPDCNTKMEGLRLNVSISVGDELAPGKMNHLVRSYPNQTCQQHPATKY